MFNGAHDTYLESRVLSADPLELVRLLYQGAIGSVQNAQRHLAEGRILERSRSITHAYTILTELLAALDRERGGEIASRLAGLYDYMQRRLLEANFRQIDAPLSEVLGLLTTISEGWAGAATVAEPLAAAASAWSQPSSQEPEANYAQTSWSL
jgi:flagellar secretion chaperone FliS